MSTLDEKNYAIAVSMIEKVSKLPMVRVDREKYLVELFKPRNEIEKNELLAQGPYKLYDLEVLKKTAYNEVMSMTRKTSLLSASTGLVSNPVPYAAAGLGAVDIGQYYGNLLNVLQKISYIFGQGDFFGADNKLSEENKDKILLYLGVMFSIGVAGGVFSAISKPVGKNIGKKVAASALTKTAWYPVLQKIGPMIGLKITKDGVGKSVSKYIPILGAAISGSMTYVTFKPMGKKLVDKFVENADEIFKEEDEVVINL